MTDMAIGEKYAPLGKWLKEHGGDSVKLTFDEEALRAIAQEALKRKTGARGLRSIIERIMRNVMYEIPSQEGVTACRVTKDVVQDRKEPVLSYSKRRSHSKEASA